MFRLQNIPLQVRLFHSLPEIVEQIAPTVPTAPLARSSSGGSAVPAEEMKVRDETFLISVADRVKTLWGDVKKAPWRSLAAFVAALPGFQSYFPSLEYNDYFLDELCMMLKGGNMQVKSAAADAICALLLRNHHAARRSAVFSQISMYAQSSCCYDRISFLVFAESAVNNFSQTLIRTEKVVPGILQLAGDKVAGVRMRFIGTAERTIPCLREDAQKELIGRLRDMQKDKDREVRRLAAKACDETRVAIEEKNAEWQDRINEEDEKRDLHEKELLEIVLLLQRRYHFLGRGGTKTRICAELGAPGGVQAVHCG